MTKKSKGVLLQFILNCELYFTVFNTVTLYKMCLAHYNYMNGLYIYANAFGFRFGKEL